MDTCGNCGRDLAAEWKFCIHCGTRVQRQGAEPVDLTPPVLPVPREPEPAVLHQEPREEPAPAPAPLPEQEPRRGPAPRSAPEPARASPSGAAPFNVLAVLALIFAGLLSPLAALFGHLALRQIRRDGERGRTVAITATILGYLWLAAWAVGLALILPGNVF